MSVRERFDEDLKKLESMLSKLTDFTLDALKTPPGTENQDINLALEIMDDDSKADLLYEEINDFAILLITKQQPVASDLRKIIMTIKIATDLERIADFAVNIARSTIRIGKDPVKMEEPMDHITRMYSISEIMLSEGIKAFINEDTETAKKWRKWMMKWMIYMMPQLSICLE